MDRLEGKYQTAKQNPSDIYQHIETIYRYARECESVAELGTRSCVSIWASLKALAERGGGQLFGVDLIRSPGISEVEQLAQEVGVSFKFIMGNDLHVDLGQSVDLVFIDSWHVYGQLKRELAKYAPLTKKYIVMHDTTVDEHVGETIREGSSVTKHARDNGFPWIEVYAGLWPAVMEFLENNTDWVLEKRFTHCNGLTILKRRSSTSSGLDLFRIN